MELRLQVQASEIAFKEVKHVTLELHLSCLQELREAESIRQFYQLNHLG